ncbi:hypothetical protein Glove_362g9 [Diversispora epigaea]|uniref:Uncharacterized protein n=1 Tax=Diversispora epigaea TaxID=1348612 RepID=A0A397HEE7_9GLOM|nr:hypothetical protein Glove_362g9 [Diversispora epigaea]
MLHILETSEVDETHSYTKRRKYISLEKLIHNRTWKESEEKISCIVEDIWNNPTLTSEVAKKPH